MKQDNARTDPRILRTRQLLKDAFIDLIQEMDIEKISVNRIAERATINRVTFYLHYRDIPDMLEKMADEMIEDIQQAMNREPRHAGSIVDKDLLVMVSLLEHIAENAKFYKVVLRYKRMPIFTDRLLKMFTELVTNRLENERKSLIIDAGIQKDIAIWHGSASLIGIISAWLQNDMPYTPEYLAKQFSLLLKYKNGLETDAPK